jgi:hypothetical protein
MMKTTRLLTSNLIVQVSVPPSATSGGTVSGISYPRPLATRLLTFFALQATTFPVSVSVTPTTPVSSRSAPLSAHKSANFALPRLFPFLPVGCNSFSLVNEYSGI